MRKVIELLVRVALLAIILALWWWVTDLPLSTAAEWALVAGASEGLGAAFGDELAGRGLNLVLVARRAALLDKAAEQIRARHGVDVRTIALDLSQADAVAELKARTEGLEIGLLVCNAALAFTGRFLDTDFATYSRILDLNCRANLGMIHWLGGMMAARGRGGIIVMSSLAGFQGSPYVAVYGASKAFLINLSEALWKELGDRGVDVTVCAAPAIRTPGYLASKKPGTSVPGETEPAVVARTAVAALGHKPVAVASALGRFSHFLMGRLMTRKAAVKLMASNTAGLFEE